MNQSTEDLKKIYSDFKQKMRNLFDRKKVLVASFRRRLENRKIKELDIKLEIGENETHNSIFPSALSNGLRFVFDGI